MSERLLTFLYQFGVGGAVYLVSVIALYKTGALGTENRVRRRRLAWVTVLFLTYLVGQGVLQFAGPEISCNGGAP
ncbi:MAG: hypothetical protein RBU30_17400 [Polyangia bacterium]|jgi:hypothetical protein|nr:hypothetical protein [Polyangia bacterium]